MNELHFRSLRYDNLLHIATAIGLVDALGLGSRVGWTSIVEGGGTVVLRTPLNETGMRMRVSLRIGAIHSAWKAFGALAPHVQSSKRVKTKGKASTTVADEDEPRRTSAASFRDLMLADTAVAELVVPYYTVSVTDGVGLYKSPLQMSVRTPLMTTADDLLAPASALLTTRSWIDSLIDPGEWIVSPTALTNRRRRPTTTVTPSAPIPVSHKRVCHSRNTLLRSCLHSPVFVFSPHIALAEAPWRSACSASVKAMSGGQFRFGQAGSRSHKLKRWRRR